MKLTKHLFGFALTAIAAGAFVACTNELKEPGLENGLGGLKLVRTPEVYAWSGQQTLLSDTYTVPTPAVISTRDDVARDFNTEMFSVTTEIVKWAYNDGWEGQYNNDNDKGPAGLIHYLTWTSGVVGDGHDPRTSLTLNYILESVVGTDFTIYPYTTGATDQANKKIGLFYYDSEGNRHDQIIWEVGDDDIYNFSTGNITGLHITFTQPCKFGLYFSGRTHDSQKDENDVYIDDALYYTLPSINEENYPEQAYPEHTGIVPEGKYPSELSNAMVMFVEDWDDFDYDDFALVMIGNNLPNVKENPSDEDLISPEPNEDKVCKRCGHKHNGPSFDCEECEENGVDEDHQPCLPCENCGHNHVGPSTDCPYCERDGHQEENYPGTCLPEQPGENCSQCGHPNHGTPGEGCKECEKNGGPINEDHQSCWKEQDGNENQGSTTTTPEPSKHDNEVEVNFELVDSHKNPTGGNKYGNIEDLATKLSIHVRHATDVEIKIPIPASYVIDSDDLYIFNEHDVTGVYGGELQNGVTTLTYNIYQKEDGSYKTVTLNVKVVVNPEGETRPFNEGYILVWTDGIDEEVIDWCMKHNGDGINFEVWTYFNQLAGNTRDGLKSYLNQSVIRFINSDPEYYINAFGYDYEDGTWGQQRKPNDPINPDDCHVTPVDKSYTIKNTGTHLNGTPYNDIYTKGNKQPDHAHSQTN